MAKIVSEKRENQPMPSAEGASKDAAAVGPLVNLLGIALVALFIIGAIAVAVMTFQRT